MKLIGGKWKRAIILILHSKPERFNKIKQLLDGISGNVLTTNLRELERDGIVYKVHHGVPKYTLTESGYKIGAYLILINEILEALATLPPIL
mgnify:CR=1 FL=1